MGLFKKLAGLFGSTSANSDGPFYRLAVRCHRCGEVISGQVNLSNELSQDFEEVSDAATYHVRKVLMGSGRCFQQIEVTLKFDATRKLLEREITGGKFVEQ